MRNAKGSSCVAKDRLKYVLINDRAGTDSNNDMIEMIKAEMIEVLLKYVDVDANNVDININTKQNIEEGRTTCLSANFPIKQVKVLGRNKH